MMNRASVQYSDLIGTAAADQHGDLGLVQLAEAAGINISRYFPVGIEASGSPSKLAGIFAIDMQGVGPCSYDSVQQHLRNAGSAAKTIRFEIDADHPRLFDYFRRLVVTLFLRTIAGLDKLNFESQAVRD